MAMQGNRSGPAAQALAVSFFGINSGPGGSSIGALQAFTLGGPTSWLGDNTFARHLQVGVLKNITEGNPAQPSLQLDIPGFWRFRWSVRTGARTIQVSVKQVVNATPRPTMVVKAASGILASDQTGTAGSSTGWVTISISFTALADGPLWVELHNNYYGASNTPTYFDHLVAT